MIDNQDKRRLELVGITYNQIESGVYAVILQETGGERRIPIIIGFPEAQAIECRLQEIVPPRPLTHDMLADILHRFSIDLTEVQIYRLPNGVFAADLILRGENGIQTVDSRSSDAIALAVRVGAPIYTSEQVLAEVGFAPDKAAEQRRVRTGSPKASASQSPSRSARSLDDLRARMQKAAEEENYELAARLKAEIDSISDSEKPENSDMDKAQSHEEP